MLEYIEKIWLNSLASINRLTISDIYSFSFYVNNEDDDPRHPLLTIGYNTEVKFETELRNASDELDVRWNYAYWLQNEIAVMGNSDDKEGRLIISKWISNLGLDYSDKEIEEDYDLCLEKGQQIEDEFIKMLIALVKRTHRNKVTSLPILIHGLEYDEKVRDQNILANGEVRVRGFTNWINKM